MVVMLRCCDTSRGIEEHVVKIGGWEVMLPK